MPAFQFGEIVLLKDFPKVPENHPDSKRPRRYFNFSLH